MIMGVRQTRRQRSKSKAERAASQPKNAVAPVGLMPLPDIRVAKELALAAQFLLQPPQQGAGSHLVQVQRMDDQRALAEFAVADVDRRRAAAKGLAHVPG